MTRRLAAPLLAVVLAGCGGTGEPRVDDAVLGARIEAVEAEVRTRIGPAACLIDADCRALPMGALACGGPSGFVPYSIRGTDEGALARLSADHQRLSSERLAARQAVGPCVALSPPVPRCDVAACTFR